MDCENDLTTTSRSVGSLFSQIELKTSNLNTCVMTADAKGDIFEWEMLPNLIPSNEI